MIKSSTFGRKYNGLDMLDGLVFCKSGQDQFQNTHVESLLIDFSRAALNGATLYLGDDHGARKMKVADPLV
jgi:hypothetical protein